jgi:hypothetical protein
MNPTEQEFITIVNSTPGLCENGIGSEIFFKTTGVNFVGSKKLLLKRYREFILCCNWLDKMCLPVETVSWNSPTSRVLQDLAKQPTYVCNGAMIAALISRHIPYTVNSASPNVNVAISRDSSCFSAH